MAPLEVRIPIGDNKSMWTRVALIAKAIRMQVPEAVITVFVGTSHNAFQESEWGYFRWLGQAVQVVQIPIAEFKKWENTNNPHAGTIMARFAPPFYSENVLFLDADVLPVGEFMSPFAWTDSLAGMIAHAPPAPKWDWDSMSEEFLNDVGALNNLSRYEYTGYPFMSQYKWAPPYFNTGILYAKKAYLEDSYSYFADAVDYLYNNHNTYFVDQIALLLATASYSANPFMLDLRWNWPNDVAFEQNQSVWMKDLRFIHFLRQKSDFDRDADFENLDKVEMFTRKVGLGLTETILQGAVRKYYEAIQDDLRSGTSVGPTYGDIRTKVRDGSEFD